MTVPSAPCTPGGSPSHAWDSREHVVSMLNRNTHEILYQLVGENAKQSPQQSNPGFSLGTWSMLSNCFVLRLCRIMIASRICVCAHTCRYVHIRFCSIGKSLQPAFLVSGCLSFFSSASDLRTWFSLAASARAVLGVVFRDEAWMCWDCGCGDRSVWEGFCHCRPSAPLLLPGCPGEGGALNSTGTAAASRPPGWVGVCLGFLRNSK